MPSPGPHRRPPEGDPARISLGARRAWLGLVLSLLWLDAGTAAAGRIEGRIVLPSADAGGTSISAYPGRLGAEIDAPAPAQAAVEEVAVYLDLPRRSAKTIDVPEMNQVQLRFSPRVLIVPVGTTVAFPNLDPVFHNVFSYSKTKRFDLGRYRQGSSKSVTFERQGLVKVFCDVHASMSAFILVVDSDFVAQPDASGRFVIDDVPEGPQTVRMWHPDRGEREIVVDVGAGTTDVEITY